MKKLILIALLAGYSHCFAQKRQYEFQASEHISKKFALQKSAQTSIFALFNVWGNVKIEGHSGNEVIIEIDQTILARTEEALADAKREVKLGFAQNTDSVIAYTAAPYDTRPHHNQKTDAQMRYIVKLNYTVKVPNGVNLNAHTINDGIIEIKDVYGALQLTNINGAISVANAKGNTNASAINGNLVINYAAMPAANCNYRTINGKIEVTYPQKITANVQFKSMNGEFFTDFENAETMPAQVVTTENRKANKVIYRLNKNTRVSLNGGNDNRQLNFETLNGNIYLKKS